MIVILRRPWTGILHHHRHLPSLIYSTTHRTVMSVKQVRTIQCIFGYVCSIGRGGGGGGEGRYLPTIFITGGTTHLPLSDVPRKKYFGISSNSTNIIIEYLVIGRAKRAPHWGVESRFCVIYMCVCRGPKCARRITWPNTRMLKVGLGRLKQTCDTRVIHYNYYARAALEWTKK